ncbi:MAG: phosphoenolpyruvate synthase [Simkaniaceae bacterium]
MIYIKNFEEISKDDVKSVGGKNASLGEMIRSLKSEGVAVPDGFATTSEAYQFFLDHNQLKDKIVNILDAYKAKKNSLKETGKEIRGLIQNGEFPTELQEKILSAYQNLSRKYNEENIDVAVRSSATAEDLPTASFAGQQETYLHIQGGRPLLNACKNCFASLFTDRAISYREEKGFDHLEISLSIGIQKMIRSDLAGSGVMFTLDMETGFPEVVVVNACWGLGENVVQGAVNPDEYVIFKPLLNKKEELCPILEKKLGKKEKKLIYSKHGETENIETKEKEQNAFVLSDEEILTLAKWAVIIEKHYKMPMDIEWAKDGNSNQLFIVQARPETVQSQQKKEIYRDYTLKEKGSVLVEGLSIGNMIATGEAQVIENVKEIAKFQEGSILITQMTSPDWVPIMKKAKGIITDHGGRTSHAAIVSRELGIPAIVGSGNATKVLKTGQGITLSCAEGEKGFVYDGILEFETFEIDLKQLPEIETDLMLNIASPEAAFRWWRLPVKGIGLARMEFIINNLIKIHPMALIHFDLVKDKEEKQEIQKLTKNYSSLPEYFVDKLSRGIAKMAASQYPHPVIVRLSDFKTNEYANLIGGKYFEPQEENPMLGFRGASRYYNEKYREGFELECRAIKRVRENFGLENVLIMIPFCRTLEEADKVLGVLAQQGLSRGEKGLQIYVMCEIPSNVILAEEFAKRFDGFSIGSNDLTQLTLGIDRDSEELAPLFNERNPAVKKLIQELIPIAHENQCKVGICGEAPSNYPEFAKFLVEQKIDSISLNPDSVIKTIQNLS